MDPDQLDADPDLDKNPDPTRKYQIFKSFFSIIIFLDKNNKNNALY